MMRRHEEAAYAVAFALLLALCAGSLLILAYGESPAHVYRLMIARTWGDTYGTGQVLFRASMLIFTGLSVAMAYQAGLFNIGAEGQLTVGSFACAIVGAALPGSLSGVVAVPIALAAAAAGGMAVGALPGYLKARFGAHEVINTIMLNFIVGALVLWLARAYFYDNAQAIHTASVSPGALLPSLGLAGSAASLAFPLGVLVALVCAGVLAFTRVGFELRALGKSASAAEGGGVAIGATVTMTMAFAGALAGLVGACTVLGYKGYFEEKQAAGMGFMGIAVALLARGNPLGVIFAALLFGTLAEGSLAASALIPKEIIDVLQAVVILAIAVAAAMKPAPARAKGAA